MNNINNEYRTSSIVKIFSLLLALSLPSFLTAAPVDFATKPLSTVSSAPIKPNLLFIFDDSGSMDRDYMPDWANSGDSFELDASYNTIAYNPAITYTPPANFTTSGQNTTTYPSQIGVSNATGGSGASAANPRWNYVRYDAYGKLGTGRTNLENLNAGAGPIFWTTIPSEFCKKADLKDCNTQSAPDFSAGYIFPAPIRWCNNATNADRVTTPNPAPGACQKARVTPYTHLRSPETVPPPGTAITTINFSGQNYWKRVNGITVGGYQIMRSSTDWTSSTNAAVQQAADRINQCTTSAVGNCDVSGVYAEAQGSNLLIYAPAIAAGQTPSVNENGLYTSSSAFVVPPAVAGGRIKTTITPSDNTYPYPGSTVKHGNRTDCTSNADNTCSYAEEMTNYANWYAYYRTRVQMMKTASSHAFKDINSDFRVGFMTTSAQGDRSLDIKPFDAEQKAAWYSKLFNTVSDYWTPLRGSLATAGRIFANKTSAHGTFTDPMEYECQENFALLTTDGVWNTNGETSSTAGGPVKVNGTSNVGNMDSAAPLGEREGTPARSNTLADVARYYKQTDLRTTALGNCVGELGTGSNVCETPATATTPVRYEKQTMTTYTLGLGVDGTLTYIEDYENQPGDFKDIKAGSSTVWPDPEPSNSSDPLPDDVAAKRIDDLWHAAVNGGGKYFSAKDPTDVVKQLQEAIDSIRVKVGAGAAAATSSLNPISGNNSAYLASYSTEQWTGNLERRLIDPDTGFIQANTNMCVEDIIQDNICNSTASLVADGLGGYACVTSGSDASSCSAIGGSLSGTDCKVTVIPKCDGRLRDLVDDDEFNDSRTIYMKVTDASTGVETLGNFEFANLPSAAQITFDTVFLQSNLTQASSLTVAQKANLTAQNLVEFLRGRKGYEQSASIVDNQVFRKRLAVLGDIVSSKPAFMGAPTFNFGDSGYQAFKSANASRRKMVYVGANDGMMHAFDADTFEEVWAYAPTAVIHNMWKLADVNYSSEHTYYVDGSVEISDICVATDCSTATKDDWRTILVAGLNAGGRGYFALDITDPDNPKFLWEFDPASTSIAANKGDKDLGYTFGNPFVTKRNKDDKWVVLFASGYNNIPDNSAFYNLSTTKFTPTSQYNTGDGKGYLYVVDANTGVKLDKISTNVGSTSTPSGLAKITAYVDNAPKNNKTKDVYAGDLMGNLWRFNIDAGTAFKVTSFGTSQPIMTKPVAGLINSKRVIIIGTGKYLERSDLQPANFTTQSIYAIQDDNAVATLSNPRGTLIPRTVVIDPNDATARVSGATTTTVDFDNDRGWYIDLPDSGERQNVDSRLILGTLITPTIVTQSSACQPAGYGWLNYIDYATGLQVNVAGANLSTMLSNPAAGIGFVINTKGEVITNVTEVTGEIVNKKTPTKGTLSGFQMKRSLWREIID